MKLYRAFLFKLHQPADQGRAVSAGRENRGGDGLEVCRHWIGNQGQQCMMAGDGRAVAEQQELQRM